MKKITLFLIVLLITGNQLFSQVLNCTIFKQGPIPENAITIGNQTLCPGQTATFCTEEVAGATYNWTVTGGPGIQINGSSTGSCVSVTVNTPGTYKLCVSKVVNGYEPCCVCVNIVCFAPPCPQLKIVVAATNSHIGYWDYDCKYDCQLNPTLRMKVVCADGTNLQNWFFGENISGDIKWELTNGNFTFIDVVDPCGNNPNCSNDGAICDLRPINQSYFMQSPRTCPCFNLTFWENFSIRATVTFRKGGATWSTVLNEVIHLEDDPNGLCGTGGGGGGGGIDKTKSLVSDVKMFPNPANENVSLSFSLSEKVKAEIELYDVKGNKVLNFINPKNLEKGSHQFTANTADLKDKLYFVVIKVNDVIVQKKALAIE